MGNTDPFLMGPDYVPVRGHPPVPVRHARRRRDAGDPGHGRRCIEEAGIDAVREKSEQLTTYAVELADEHLAPYGVTVRLAARPRSTRAATSRSTTRGCRRSSPALWERDVIPDYRDPGGLRIGLSPLSTSYDELERGIDAVRQVMASLD